VVKVVKVAEVIKDFNFLILTTFITFTTFTTTFKSLAHAGDLKEQVIQLIENHYYLPLNTAELEKKSLSEIFQVLDKDSSLISPSGKNLDFVRGFKKKTTLGNTSLLEEHIAYIPVTYFSGSTLTEFENAFKPLQQQGADKLILDLRGNPGGDFEAAIDFLEFFVPEGETISILTFRNNKKLLVAAGFMPVSQLKTNAPIKSLPPTRSGGAVNAMAILINAQTASCAELAAVTLRNFQKAKLIGTRTQGKKTVQRIYPVGSQWLALTVGTWTKEPFVVPDVEVTDPEEQLQKAISVLTEQQ
jgi:carboxyl-terminal processing protease